MSIWPTGLTRFFFAGPLENQENLLVPTIYITEVFKKILQQRGENSALHAAALMRQGRVVDLDGVIAVEAARLGYRHDIPLADGIILATAHMHKAVIWTQDAAFKSLKNVRYRERK